MGICNNKTNVQYSKNPEETLKVKPTQSEKEQSKPLEAKIVLLGDQFVGKSSIAQRYCRNLFTGKHVTTVGGAYFQQKLILGAGIGIKFHIWDTGGHERFRSMTNLYYRDASVAILTYDITNEKTFESMNYWVEELENKCGQENIVLCLAGNKCDVEMNERKVSYNAGKDTHRMIFFETSAKNDIGIKELFNAIGKKLYENKIAMEKEKEKASIK